MKRIALYLILLALSFNTIAGGYEKFPSKIANQGTIKPGSIEVIEFFWYGCPHCYTLEPLLNEWLKTKPENITFIKRPIAFGNQWEAHAKLYFTEQVLHLNIDTEVFDILHKSPTKLTNKDEVAALFEKHGISKERFDDAYNSMWVRTQVEKSKIIADTYGLNGVPAFSINGIYKITGTTALSTENMVNVLKNVIEEVTKK